MTLDLSKRTCISTFLAEIETEAHKTNATSYQRKAFGGRSRGDGFALRTNGIAFGILARQEELTQHVKVAAQDTKPDIAFESQMGMIATTLQSIPGLQRSDRRLNAWMTLTRGVKLIACVFLLTLALMLAGHR